MPNRKWIRKIGGEEWKRLLGLEPRTVQLQTAPPAKAGVAATLILEGRLLTELPVVLRLQINVRIQPLVGCALPLSYSRKKKEGRPESLLRRLYPDIIEVIRSLLQQTSRLPQIARP